MTAFVLAAAAVFPAVFTGLAVWAAVAGNGPGMLAGGLLAATGWTVWGFLAVWLLPRPKKRARWTAEEIAALNDTTGLKRVLDAAPRKGRR